MKDIAELQSCRVPLTGGNIRNNHFYLRGCESIIPTGGIGGKSVADSGRRFAVNFEPGSESETDVDGSKMILRARGAVRDFYVRSGAAEGDQIIITRTAERELTVTLLARAPL